MHQGKPPGSLPSYEQRGAVRYSDLIVSFTCSCFTCNLHRASNRIPRQSARHRKNGPSLWSGKLYEVCPDKATPCLGNELRFGEFTDLAARNPGLLLEGEGLQSPLLGQVSVLDACL